MKRIRPAIEFIRDNLGDNLVGAEIGVWRGMTSEYICRQLKLKKFFCVDCWRIDFLARKPVRKWLSAESALRKVKKRLKPYPFVEIIKKDSFEASKLIKDNSLDFVYIDALHTYRGVKEDMVLWTPKVRKGGIVSGHDFGYKGVYGVNLAVAKYVYHKKITGYFKSADWWFVK